MTIKKILITGSSGTIGTRLCEKLIEKKYEVVGLDYRPNEWQQNIQKITLDIDLRDKQKFFDKVPKDIDIIIHLAANARVYNLTLNPTLAKDNFDTIFNVLEFSRKNNIKKFIFASSREVYGNAEQSIYTEKDNRVENCESPYSASKVSGEALIYAYRECYDLDFVIFRFSNVYGMYDNSDRVIPLFIRLAKENKDLTIFGKDKLLDFTYIDDTVDGIISSIDNFDKAKNNSFNLAYGEEFSILKLAEKIKDSFKSDSKIVLQEKRLGEVVKYIADISKAKSILNYSPKVNIMKGLEKSLDWYNKNC